MMVTSSTVVEPNCDRVSMRTACARGVCLVMLTTAAACAAALATPAGAAICGGCGDRYGFAFARVAALGACGLGAALVLLLPADVLERRPWAGIPTLAGAIAHMGLILSRPSDACAACLVVFGLEIAACIALVIWYRDGAISIRLNAAAPGIFATALLATGGTWGLYSMLEAAEPTPIIDAGALQRTLAHDPRAADRIVLRLIVKPGCSRCAWYMENLHEQLVEWVRSHPDVELDPKIYDLWVPGELEAGAYPAIHLSAVGTTAPMVRIEPVRSVDSVIEAVERLHRARRDALAAR